MLQVANVSPEMQYNVFKRDGFTCRRCKKKVPPVVLYVGYEIPPEEGGTDDVDNLITLCYDCSGGHPLEMLSERCKQLDMILRERVHRDLAAAAAISPAVREQRNLGRAFSSFCVQVPLLT